MTKLVNKVGLLIKQERLTPERKPKDDSKKSSSEILSELFGAFNADPPKIEDISSKKTKKNKKKHKKEKKKRSRSSSSSSSDNSEYSHKRKKRKKSKTKKRKEPDRSPCSRSCTPPLLLIPHPEPKVKLGTERKKAEDCKKNKEEVSKKIKEENCKKNKEEVCKKIKEEDCKKNKEEVCKKIKEEDCKKNREEVCKKIKEEDCKKNKEEDCKKTKEEDGKKIKEEVVVATKAVVKSEPTEVEKKENLCIKNEDKNSNDASLIPMPESPKLKDECCDLQIKVEKKSDTNGDSDKSKCKIQIKNLKFSTVFEETVKQAEEEARKKAEKKEEGEYTDSSCGSPKEDAPSFSQFPKSSDPGGILKKQAAAEEIKILEEEKIIAKKACAKLTESSHKSSRKDTEKPKERGKSKEKDSSKSHKRSKSKSKKSRSRSPTRRHKSSRDDTRRRSRSRHRSKSKRSRSRGRLRYPSPRHRDRDRGRRSRSPSGVKLADSEKKRLLEVARRNAINMLKNGAVPAGAAALPPHTRNQVMAAIQSGGKSVDELTDFCKHLSKKEALGELSSVSSNDDGMSENEDTIAFHHPFLVKEKGPIVLNIRGAAPLPIKSTVAPIANKEELRLQFPVSSGSQHREKASEWVPVSPKKDNMQIAKLNSKPAKSDDSPEKPKEPLALPAPPPKSTPAYLNSFTSGSQLSSVPALAAPGPQAYPPDADSPKIDMATIVSQKIAMIRKEQEDNEITSTRGVSTTFGWEQSDTALGEFKGSTGAQILTPRELASGTQAWAKKDQLSRAAPVEGGMGMHLLQKMGWTPGQGLGKEGTGTLQPLLLEVKLDTRGLQAKEEVSTRASKGMKSQRISRCRGPAPLIAGGKHPVSLLGEYCSKQKLGPPEYTLCFECGPDHKKNFLFKVKVAGVEYQPAVASANKKQAKADAAQLALQKIGIVT